MSHPIGFAQANTMLMRPLGMTAEQCASLEVFRGEGQCISRWQFTDAELDELKRNGGKCYVQLWGDTQPPVYISPITPFA